MTGTNGIVAAPSPIARQPSLALPIQQLAQALQSGQLPSAKAAFVNLSQASAGTLSPVMQSALSQVAHSLLYSHVPNATRALAQFQSLMNVPSSAPGQEAGAVATPNDAVPAAPTPQVDITA